LLHAIATTQNPFISGIFYVVAYFFNKNNQKATGGVAVFKKQQNRYFYLDTSRKNQNARHAAATPTRPQKLRAPTTKKYATASNTPFMSPLYAKMAYLLHPLF
jgi:hypothetical protein